jgi:hypothetical protein
MSALGRCTPDRHCQVLADQRPILGPEAAGQPEKPAVTSNGRSRPAHGWQLPGSQLSLAEFHGRPGTDRRELTLVPWAIGPVSTPTEAREPPLHRAAGTAPSLSLRW